MATDVVLLQLKAVVFDPQAQHFITTMDSLKLNMKAVDEVKSFVGSNNDVR